MLQIILDNYDWYPEGTKRYAFLKVPPFQNINYIIQRLLEIYVFRNMICDTNREITDISDMRENWLYRRNWWKFFYFTDGTREIVEMSKPLWYILKRYNLFIDSKTILFIVKTRNMVVLNEVITERDVITMTNYHVYLENILIQYLPIEIIYYICDFIY